MKTFQKTMKTTTLMKQAGCGIVLALVAAGCGPQSETSTSGETNAPANVPAAGEAAATGTGTPEPAAATATAAATLNPTEGSQVKGTVTLTQETNGVHVIAEITGLTPGEHGFHIHEAGDCSAPDASSAGGHFNPTGMPHGGPDSEQHHVGDLGNVTADDSGMALLDRVFSFLSLTGTNTVVGHAVIVHGGRDDLTSQPSGDAGARVACGVIAKQ